MNKPLLHALLLALPFLAFTGERLLAAEITPESALRAAEVWLELDSAPLGVDVKSALASEVQSFPDAAGRALYHAVRLDQAGVVIVSGDDRLPPVIAWMPDATSIERDLGATLRGVFARDIKGRLAQAESARSAAGRHPMWDMLNQNVSTANTRALTTTSITDMRVPPVVESIWGQGFVYGYDNLGHWSATLPAYNYYTPNNYPCGIFSTMMAEFMRHHQYPLSGIGGGAYTVYVDGTPQSRNTIGGDGLGGAYDWSSMVTQPDYSITETQRKAIGALTHDAGVVLNTAYTSSNSTPTIAYLDTPGHTVANRLRTIFGYSNAITIRDYVYSNFGNNFLLPINSNLEAGLPVFLTFYGDAGAFFTLCDGYGYSLTDMYHHFNLGNEDERYLGNDTVNDYRNLWYNIPKIVDPRYRLLEEIVYNIYPTTNGEIISGRVLDNLGDPAPGIPVTASHSGHSWVTVTNEYGMYGIHSLPSNTTFTVRAAKGGWVLPDTRYATTGQSLSQDSYNCGNVSGVDFTGTVIPGWTEFDILSFVPAIIGTANGTAAP